MYLFTSGETKSPKAEGNSDMLGTREQEKTNCSVTFVEPVSSYLKKFEQDT